MASILLTTSTLLLNIEFFNCILPTAANFNKKKKNYLAADILTHYNVELSVLRLAREETYKALSTYIEKSVYGCIACKERCTQIASNFAIRASLIVVYVCSACAGYVQDSMTYVCTGLTSTAEYNNSAGKR